MTRPDPMRGYSVLGAHVVDADPPRARQCEHIGADGERCRTITLGARCRRHRLRKKEGEPW